MRHVSLAAAIAAPLYLAACSYPYTLQVTDVNLTSPQRRATITLSDAQLYTRSRLINDRQLQIQQIRKWIDEIPTQNFKPQIAREVELIRSLALDIAAAFNPTAGKQTSREQAIDDKKTELQLLQLEQQIADLKKRIASGEAAPQDKENNGQAPARDAATEAVPDASGATIAAIQKRLDDLAAEVKKLSGPQGNDALTDSKANSSPEELLRDRLTFQNELFAALNQVELDDRHDLDGNALYRLQFRATVFPDKEEGKLGIARVTVLPPVLRDDKLRELYQGWLHYATQRINRGDQRGVSSIDIRLLSQRGLLSILEREIGGEKVALAIAPSSIAGYDIVRRSLRSQTDSVSDLSSQATREDFEATLKILNSVVSQNDRKRLQTIPIDFVTWNESRAQCLSSAEVNEKDYQDAIRVLRFGSSLLASVRALPVNVEAAMRDIVAPYSKEQEEAEEIVQIIGKRAQDAIGAVIATEKEALRKADEEAAQDLTLVLRNRRVERQKVVLLHKDNVDKLEACLASYKVDEGVEVPDAFKVAISETQLNGKASWRGDIFVYSSSPTEYVQRVSSVASASEAFSLVAALSAMIPETGLDIEAGAQLMNQAVGNVHALERAPLVVGFSEHGNDGEAIEAAYAFSETPVIRPTIENLPRFGWAFGPRITLDARNQKLRLQQGLVNQPVTADLSVPGWWPYIAARVETAWVGTLESGVLDANAALESSGQVNVSYLKIPIADELASMDALTTRLVERNLGRQYLTAHIEKVMPDKLIICPNAEISLIIRGQNLWRGTRAFLNGREAKAPITILPDMQGIVVRFDPIDLPSLMGAESGSMTLDIITQNGDDDWPLAVKKEGGAEFCLAAASPGKTTGRLQTTMLHPEQKEVMVGDLANFPAGLFSVKLGLYKADGGKIESDFPGKRIPGQNAVAFNNVAPKDTYLEGADAVTLTSALGLVLNEGGGESYYPINGRLVFYGKADSAKVLIGKAESSQFKADPPTAAELKETAGNADFALALPAYVLVAYPGLADTIEVKVAFEKDGKSSAITGKLQQSIRSLCETSAGARCVAQVDLVGVPLGDALRIKGAKMTVQFAGQNMPADVAATLQ